MYRGDEHKKPHLKTGLFSIIRTKVILVGAHTDGTCDVFAYPNTATFC